MNLDGLLGDMRRIRAIAQARATGEPSPEDSTRYDWFGLDCPCGVEPGQCVEHPRARESQRPPAGSWRVWLFQAGRGAGKSFAGAQYLINLVQRGEVRAPILAGPTASDVRDIMVSAVLDASPPWARPKYFPSRRSLVWPNGVKALLLSGEDPEQFRGPNCDFAWVDELGAWSRPRDAWRNLSLAVRKGNAKTFVSTTPRRTATLIELAKAPTTITTNASTLDNRRHLSTEFVDQILALYSGTKFARQEIEGHLIEVNESAWFNTFDPSVHISEKAAFDPSRPVIIGIDAGTSRTTAAVLGQVRRIDSGRRMEFTIFADYLAQDRFSAANAQAIMEVFNRECPGGRLDQVWIDPASAARTSIGVAAYQEYAVVFTRALNPSPPGPVTDSLDAVTGLLDRRDIIIHPRCAGLIEGFRNYARAERGGEYLDVPRQDQSPFEDPIDALRYLVRGTWPEGRTLPAKHRVTAFRTLF